MLSGGHRKLRIVAMIYTVLGIVSLLFVPASLYEVGGIESDPLSSVFALFLGLPWTLSLGLFDKTGTWTALAVCAAGIGLNSYILFRLAGRKRKSD